MRAHTITITSLLACALAIPASASAATDSGYSGLTTGIGSLASESSSQSGSSRSSDVDSGYAAQTTGIGSSASESTSQAGSPDVDAGYAALTTGIGSSGGEPTVGSPPPADTADGFDWGDAALGAGAAMALVALGGAALLTVRRRTAMPPSASTS